MHDIRPNENPNAAQPNPSQPVPPAPQPRPDMTPGGSSPDHGDRPVPREEPAPAASPSVPPAQQPAPQPVQPVQPQPTADRVAQVNLHPEQAGHAPHPDDWARTAPSSQPIQSGASYEVTGLAPTPPPAPEPAPAPVAPPPQQPQPAMAPQPAPVAPAQQPEKPMTKHGKAHRSLVHSLRTLKYGLLALFLVLAVIAFFFVSQATRQQPDTSTPRAPVDAPGSQSVNSAEGGYAKPVSCIGTTGTDASTDSKTFQDVEGTECNYRTGDSPETLILNGKLTGRNTEGTGMSVNINVNGKVCSGGESLNYARTFTPMVSNCVFDVPANSSVAIKWQFLSPFGGSASVLRSSKNIAPSITGVAIPKAEGGSGG